MIRLRPQQMGYNETECGHIVDINYEKYNIGVRYVPYLTPDGTEVERYVIAASLPGGDVNDIIELGEYSSWDNVLAVLCNMRNRVLNTSERDIYYWFPDDWEDEPEDDIEKNKPFGYFGKGCWL